MSLRRKLFKGGWVGLMGCALAASVMSFPAAAQLAPVAGTHYAGRASDTGFEGAVNSQGGYSASVPLDLPGARGGLPVPVHIVYGGNRVGAAGLGWDVPLSYIYRDSTIAHHRPGRERLSLTLDGQPIALVRNAADTAWVAQHNNTQLEVRAVGDNMVLYDGEGRKYIFSPQGAGGSSHLIDGNLYMLVGIYGPGGNLVTLTYKFEAPALPGGGTGLSINLTRVRYNPSPTTTECFKNSVLLNYDAGATDSPPPPVLSMSLLGGTVLARVGKIFKATVISQASCTEAEVPLRTYLFNYQPDVDTRLPRLQSVTMTGQKGTPEQSTTLPVAAYSYGSIVDPATGKITYQLTPNAGPPRDPTPQPTVGVTAYQYGIGFTTAVNSPEPHDPGDTLVDLFTPQNFIDVNGDGRPDFLGVSDLILVGQGPLPYRVQNNPGPDGTTVLSGALVFPIDANEKIHSAVIGDAATTTYRIDRSVNDTLRQIIDMNGDGRLDVVETVLPDIDHWIIHLNTPDPTDPKKSVFVDITVPVTRMRAALNTTGLSFGRVPLARTTTVPESFSENNLRKRTITEFELKDVNGDGYPDFVYNASFVRTSGAAGVPGDMTGSRDVKVLINTAGVHLTTGADLFSASPITLEAGGSGGCGISRWEADPSSANGGILNEACAFEDVNGDGIADRINSVVENGQVVAKAALGTGVPTHPYATDAVITLPGPLVRTETDLIGIRLDPIVLSVPATCLAGGPTFDLRRTRGLRDINGDGIPDYIVGQVQGLPDPGIWTVAFGTGAGFAPPVNVDSPAGLEPSREQSVCGVPAEAGEVSATPSGLYDIDGDGQPELVNLNRADPSNPHWEIYQLKPPAAQLDVGPVASVPAAGRLTEIDPGYGAITLIGYKSAKEDTQSVHQLPYPEIVVAAVATTDSGTNLLVSSTRYAYGGSGLIFDSVSDAFVFPGYQRTVQLRGTNAADANEGIATLRDTYPLEQPFTAAAFPDAAARFRRYQRAGRVSDVTTIAGTLGTDPWALLGTNIATDARRISGAHHTYDARLLASGLRAPGSNEVCMDMMFPYDFAGSQGNSLADDQCTQIGFSFQKETNAWRGTPGAADPFSSTATVKTKTVVSSVDDLGRVTDLAQFNDVTRTDDDLCVHTAYATPTGTNERVLSAVASRTTTSGTCTGGTTITLASETLEYDKLSPNQVAAGFVTAKTVSRRRTDDGTPINDSQGHSDIRLFDATYDALGNPITVITNREDGATRKVTTGYDPFGLAPVSVTTDATNANGTALPSLLTSITRDPVTLNVISTTDPNLTQAGNTFDGFGRVRLSTVTPSGGASGALSSIDYLGFAIGDTGGRRIVQKAFTDPVPLDSVATAVGRTGTVFLDSLGRESLTEVQLGADYPNQKIVASQRTYDMLGRLLFEADPFPSSQSSVTAYGTTYYFNPDGTPSCFIRGRGQQAFIQATDEASERYPTCVGRTFVGNRQIVTATDAVSLLNTTPATTVLHESTYSASGQLLNRSTLTFDATADGGVGRFRPSESMDFAYDRVSNLIRIGRYPNPRNSDATFATSWKYDSLGQVLELSEPDSATQFRTYDNWGELTQTQWTDTTTTTPTDRRTITKYDALGRTVHTEDRTNNLVDAETVNEFLYDQPVSVATPPVTATNVLGRLAKAVSPTSTASFSYDGLGRINATAFTDTTTTQPAVYVEKHSYHGDGSPAAFDLLLPDTNFQKNEHVDYTYDSAGRARSVTYSDGTITQNLFTAAGSSAIDVFGRIRQAQYGAATFTADYADIGRRLINDVKVTSPSGATREISFPAPTGQVTAFDPLGRERGRREIINGDANAPTLAFTYNLLGQLSTATRTPVSTSLPNMTFGYDVLGNIGGLSAATGTSGAKLSYQSGDRDRICSIAYGSGTPNSTCNVKYDGVGNIKEMPTRSNGLRKLTYFANGQVKEVIDGSGTPQFGAQFRYDAFGALEKLDVTSNTSSDTRHDRHFGGLISTREEIVGGTKTPVITRSIPGPGLTATRHGSASMAPWTFAFGENRGNRFFTNQAGEFVQDVDYQAYGDVGTCDPTKVKCPQPGSPNYSSEQWNGGDALAALGLSHLGARLYDPVIGRFLSRDPLIIPRTSSTTNPYAFAGNDPVNSSDPTGAFQTDPFISNGEGTGGGGGGISIVSPDGSGGDVVPDAISGGDLGGGRTPPSIEPTPPIDDGKGDIGPGLPLDGSDPGGSPLPGGISGGGGGGGGGGGHGSGHGSGHDGNLFGSPDFGGGPTRSNSPNPAGPVFHSCGHGSCWPTLNQPVANEQDGFETEDSDDADNGTAIGGNRGGGRGGQGKGERGRSAKTDGNNNPGKHARPDPDRPGEYLKKDPHTGKWVPAQKGWRPNQRAIVGAAVGTAAAGVGGYLIYRGVRLIPSLFPPLWPTIPANLAIP